jgi:hypothetical protein
MFDLRTINREHFMVFDISDLWSCDSWMKRNPDDGSIQTSKIELEITIIID